MNANIWYTKNQTMIDLSKSFSFGWDFYIERNPEGFIIDETHVFIGSIPETSLDRIFYSLQGEIWNPDGAANDLIKCLDTHTSMSVGDIVQIGNDYWFCDICGWVNVKDYLISPFEVQYG
jgi:hypothetical protein